MSEEKGDLQSIIRQRLEQVEEVRKKARGTPPPIKPGSGPVPPEVEEDRPARSKPPGDGYRFLNPYNFARYLLQPQEEALHQSAETRLLTRCEPPPHDRYLGLTGRVTCTLETVTPLFVSDSHDVELDGGRKHKSYRFFQYEGQDAIPATSLRGTIRSVFEAATNSCFPVFRGERLSYRLEPGVAATLVPARVEDDPKGGWRLRLLPGFAPLNPGGRPRALYAGTVRRYDPIQPPRRRGPQSSRPPRKTDLSGLKHGDPCHALVEKRSIFTYVHELARTPGELSQPWRDSQEIVDGWLCINNQNIEPKSKERFFFRASHNVEGPAFVHLSDKAAEAYEDLIKDYQARHEDAVRARREAKKPLDKPVGKGRRADPALSRYVYHKQDRKLGEGTLVYARLVRRGRGLEVDQIAPASVPRVSYHHSIGNLLPAHLHPCREYDALCPACRTFGWVYGAHEESKEPAQDKITAYAGRVRFSHATLAEDAGIMEDVTLAILSSPKPTTTRFYLRPETGKPRHGMSDAQAGYDGANELRGRKVYRHHGRADPAEYERATGAGHDGKDDQNRTLRGARKPGNRFRFTLDFQNLAQIELGALLWSLELGGEGHHRLGFAKPLGFGSVKLEIEELALMSPMDRYTQIQPGGGWQVALTQKAGWIEEFQEAMAAVYGRPYAELENVRDLAALLSEPPDLPIHYPRAPRPPDHKPDPEGKNFEWFVGNKRKHGPKVALALADEDTEGLPLVDRGGSVIK